MMTADAAPLVTISESRWTYTLYARDQRGGCYPIWTWQLPLGSYSDAVAQVRALYPCAEVAA